MDAPSPERELYQGLLQIGLAYYQINRNNYRGALKMLQRGQRNLAPLGKAQQGIDLEHLRQDAWRLEEKLRQMGPERMANLDRSFFKPIPETRQPE